MLKFKAAIEIIGVNPFVAVPDKVLKAIFNQAGKDKGPIPIKGVVNGKPYRQTLLRFKGAWRLYINTTMLTRSPGRVGERIEITVQFDPSDRTVKPHPKLVKALKENPGAKIKFESLRPSRQQEIVRYISFLKTEESVDRNVVRAVTFLLGKGRFVGQEKP